MDSFTDFANLRETLWYIIMIGLLFYIIIAINIAYIHSQIERKAKQMPARLKTMSLNLKTIGVGLMKDNSDITGREKDQVVEEVKRYPTSGEAEENSYRWDTGKRWRHAPTNSQNYRNRKIIWKNS